MLPRLLIALSLLIATPAYASEGRRVINETPAAAQTAPVRSPAAARATRSERSRYAAREAASPEAKQYRGGDDVVIISAGAVALVLAVVLLVVLL